MLPLPHYERAVIAIAKIEDYVLNPEHGDGKHKARVFKSMLGIERRHASTLSELIRTSLSTAPAERVEDTEYGSRWTSWHEITGLNAQSAIVTVAWLFKNATPDVPELISCYIESNRQEQLKEILDDAKT